MEPTLIMCDQCSGRGLVSTGGDKLDLKRGNTVVCEACKGSGKVEAPAGPAAESPKVQKLPQGADGGSASSEDDLKEAEGVVPQVGDRCLTGDGNQGILDKTEVGDWICVPDPE